MSIQTINPSTGKLLKDYPEMSASDVDAVIEKSHAAQLAWREVSIEERAKKMKKAAEILEQNKEEYACIISQEMGKPIAAARGEIEKCQWVCHYYAEEAANYLKPELIKTEMTKSYVAYKPLGIIFAIMPWNFPFWQVFRFAAPNLMAGNAGLLSHAPICSGTGLAIEDIFKKAGFPDSLFRSLIVSNDVAAHIIQHEEVRGVTLTGSERAGKIVGAEAASNLKKVVLELGGCDPYLILKDADLEQAAEAVVVSRLANTGQVCIAAKRVIVVDEVKDEFQKIVLNKLDRFKMGDPLDESCNFGPMARADLRDEVHKQVTECVDKGAELVMGGKMPDGDGFFYPVTVLRNVQSGMPARTEEIFGPVLAFIDAKDEADAIKIADETRFGLAGAVFTKDVARGEKIAVDMIQAGSCYVNAFVGSDPRLPFGGIKASGYGRELAGEGIREFMNIKTICIK